MTVPRSLSAFCARRLQVVVDVAGDAAVRAADDEEDRARAVEHRRRGDAPGLQVDAEGLGWLLVETSVS